MKAKIAHSFAVVSLLISISLNADGQQVALKPFSVVHSTLISDLKNLRTSNPKISPEDFAKAANELMSKQGLNFVVALDALTCQKIQQAQNNAKDPSAPLNLRAALKSPLGETATLLLPEASFSRSECVQCFVSLPFLEVSGREFVTLVEGKNIKFYLPANFILNEAVLVDEKDLTTVKTRWKIPFRTVPLSVSYDGNVLYLGFEEPELSDLMLLVFGEGVFQIAPKKDLDGSKKGVLLKESPKEANNPKLAFIKFETGDLKYVVRFSNKCAN